jgi:mono/diheme cytochrome c family protein
MFLLSLGVLLATTDAYARKTKEQKAAERDAYWGVFADVYRADLALARTPPKPQKAVEALNAAISHVSAVDETAAESFKTIRFVLEESKNLVDRGDLATAVQRLTLVRKQLIEEYAQQVAPVVAPNGANGERLYMEYCSSCHGDGLGRPGRLSNQLKVVPAQFNSPGFEQIQSPFGTYAISIHGVDRSEMTSLLEIIDVDQLWSIAFYVSSLPHRAARPISPESIDQNFSRWFQEKTSDFSLSKLATSSDDELRHHLQKLGAGCDSCDQELAFLRASWALSGQAGRIGDVTKSPLEI